MTRVLLDTSAYSAFMRGDDWAKAAIQSADEIYLNATVLGELIAGFMQGSKESKNRRELEEFLASPRVGILAVDEEASERYAVILTALREAGTPVPTNDMWISASAMQYGLKLATLDSHFKKVRQILVEMP